MGGPNISSHAAPRPLPRGRAQRRARPHHPPTRLPQYNTGADDGSLYNGVAVVCGGVKWGGSGDDDAAIGDDCRMHTTNIINYDILCNMY